MTEKPGRQRRRDIEVEQGEEHMQPRFHLIPTLERYEPEWGYCGATHLPLSEDRRIGVDERVRRLSESV